MILSNFAVIITYSLCYNVLTTQERSDQIRTHQHRLRKSRYFENKSNSRRNAVFDVIEETVASGDKVSLPDFGTFERKHKEARTMRNPQTGESMVSEAKNVPAFKAGTGFKERVK